MMVGMFSEYSLHLSVYRRRGEMIRVSIQIFEIRYFTSMRYNGRRGGTPTTQNYKISFHLVIKTII